MERTPADDRAHKGMRLLDLADECAEPLAAAGLIDLMELGAVTLDGVTPDLLRRWARSKFDLGKSDEWIAWRARGLRRAFALAVARGYIDASPAEQCGPLVPIDPGRRPAAWLKELPPIDLAAALAGLRAAHGWSSRDLAERLGLTQPTVCKALALLKLPEPIRAMVNRGELTPSAARAILELPADEQRRMAELAAGGPMGRARIKGHARRLDRECRQRRAARARGAAEPPRPPGPPEPGALAGDDARPVHLQGEGRPFFVLCRGEDDRLRWKQKDPVSPERYALLELLARAWPRRVDGRTLQRKRPHGAGRGALRTASTWMKQDADMAGVFDLAGVPRRGHGLRRPPTRTNAHKLRQSPGRIHALPDGTLAFGE